MASSAEGSLRMSSATAQGTEWAGKRAASLPSRISTPRKRGIMLRTGLRIVQGIVLASACVLGAVWAPGRTAVKVVRPFLIYYGYLPSQGGRTAARRTADLFAGYPIVVFGQGWRSPAIARQVVKDAPHTTFYGYANVGYVTVRHVLGRFRILSSIGFRGVLLDEVGTGLSAHTKQLQLLVDAAHRAGLAVLLNAWDPESVLPLQLMAGVDGILCENWVYSDGTWHQPRSPEEYADLRRIAARHVRVFMGVTASRAPVSARAAAEPVLRTVLSVYGDFVGVSGPYYSASSGAVFPAGAIRRILSRL